MAIRGILFDIGDTLIDATGLHRHTLRKTAKTLSEKKPSISAEKFVLAYEEADSDPRLDKLPDLNHLYSDERIITRTFQILGLPLDKPLIRYVFRVYRKELRRNLKPDIPLSALLRTLRGEQGLRLGVVSNGTTKEQLEQLKRLEIRKFFNPILISQAVGLRKPEPAIFLLAATKWNLPLAQILVVGDRADWEVLGARRAGMKSALTTQFVKHSSSSRQENKPDFVLDQLSDLIKIIKEQNESNV